MGRHMKLICITSKSGAVLPLNTTITIDGQTVEVLGLARQEEHDGQIRQWWIVERK